ncbi:hypothetical protein UB46_01740 [Burkholderiaceae bacterium 16]|nr:hypothetical protein UB46_01740 [Burkholderiaceae bacterium 16]
MTLRIEQGKGREDRYAMLSPVLLERLRVWWRFAHAQGKMLDGGWTALALGHLNVGSVPGNGQPSSAPCRAVSLNWHA